MALITLIEEETGLAGVLESVLTESGTSFTATFYDTKTGEQRTPQATTLTFILNKDGSKREKIRASSHSTTDGLTTVTIASSGRSLPLYGAGSGSSTGNRHSAGDSIGCVTNHEGVSQINQWIRGTVGSGANALRVGDETDSDVYFYAQTNAANKPYLARISGVWSFSNDGVSSTAIGNGASVYTGGDGISVTASDIDIDTSDTVIFAKDPGDAAEDKVPVLNASSVIDKDMVEILSDVGGTVTATALDDLTDGSNADAYHTHGFQGIITATAYEALTANDAVALMPIEVKYYSQLTAADIALGDSNARRRYAVSFTPSAVQSFTTMTIVGKKVSSSTLTLTVSIQTDNSGEPSGTAVSNGTANTIATSGWSTSNAERTVTWSTAPTLTAGTTYWLVFEVDATDGTNYITLGVNSSYDENYLNFTRLTYDLDAATWGSSVTNATPFFSTTSTANALGFALGRCNATYGGRTWAFIGFVTAGVSALATGTVYTQYVTLSSLTPGSDYYLNTSNGAITASAQGLTFGSANAYVFNYKIGKALNTTTLKIQPSIKRVILRDNYTDSDSTVAQPLIFWFKPSIVKVTGSQRTSGGTYTDFGYGLGSGSSNEQYVVSSDDLEPTEGKIYQDGDSNQIVLAATTDIGASLTPTVGTGDRLFVLIEAHTY